MAPSPLDENNWEDSKKSEINTSSEELITQQNAHKEDDELVTPDASTPQEKDALSDQHKPTPSETSAVEQLNQNAQAISPIETSSTKSVSTTEQMASSEQTIKVSKHIKQTKVSNEQIASSEQTIKVSKHVKQTKVSNEQAEQPAKTSEQTEQSTKIDEQAEQTEKLEHPVSITSPSSTRPLLNPLLNPILKEHTLHRHLRQQQSKQQQDISDGKVKSKHLSGELVAAGKRKKTLRRGTKILLCILALFIVLGSVTAATGYYYYTITIKKPLAQIYRPVTRAKNEATPQPTATSAPVYDVIKGRSWNILLLGSDNDGKYVFPDVLTQVMMVVHVDTVKNTVTMVSIPRDSWVSVPGFGMHKIDQAFSLGEQQTGKFEDGVRVARDTVETDYGITIDRYAWVGLDGFSKVIDTLGGVDVDVEHPIVDDNYPNDVGKGSASGDSYAYKRIYLASGPQHLNGQEALEYVRSRHSDLVGDIGRTQRQQQVLEALKLKLNVTTVVENFSQLLSDLSGNIYTDLNESEMLAFANYGRTLLDNPIQHVTLGVGSGNQDYGDLTTIYDPSVGSDQDIVQPNCINIQPEINSIFNLGNAQSCNTSG